MLFRSLAGSRAQASSSGITIRPAILMLPRQGEPARARACLGRALEPRGAGSLRKLASLSGEAGQGRQQQHSEREARARTTSVPLAQWGIGGVADDGRTLPNPAVACQAGRDGQWTAGSMAGVGQP